MSSCLTPGEMPRPVRLDGSHVSIVPLDLKLHGDALFDASHGPATEHLHRYLPDGPFANIATYRQHQQAWIDRPDTLAYALIDRQTDVPFGSASFMRIDPSNRVLEVGYIWFSPQAQRRSAATEAMFLMARHVFETLGYRRYEWKCNALNLPSRRAAERLGFTFEGVFRNHMIVRGENRDTAWFSMIEEEWPSRRQAFMAWLDPLNFDADSLQKRSLASFRV